ncbi:MAG: hypothetical protein G01um1014106_355 [Parcubacteria group bacterium Gr01-1014_106]|nr:MAG: hypothetical protein G01um1014106_355 [Parcubacteria group bacterium Gr01-1014_106]
MAEGQPKQVARLRPSGFATLRRDETSPRHSASVETRHCGVVPPKSGTKPNGRGAGNRTPDLMDPIHARCHFATPRFFVRFIHVIVLNMEERVYRNGIRHPPRTKSTARLLRRKGFTHREIAVKLGISLGSADLWTKGIVLTSEQQHEVFVRRTEKVYTPALRARIARRSRIVLAPYLFGKKYTREDLLKKIQKFFQECGRIPFKRELGNTRAFRDHFGSWNAAIKAAGFEPNPVYFAKKVIASDGHKCDSILEGLVDDWLTRNHIPHSRGFRYGSTRLRADFFVYPNIVVEFFGLAGVHKNYDRLLKAKRVFCQRNGYRLIELYIDDLLPKSCLDDILGFLKEKPE